MSEKNANKSLRAGVLMPGDRWNRIENVAGTGLPDINCCLGGVEVWIETKYPTIPKRLSTPLFGSNHKLSQEQMNWFAQQTQAGGNSFVYIETDDRRILIHGRHADDLNVMTLNEIVALAEIVLAKPTPSEQWQFMREAIRGQL